MDKILLRTTIVNTYNVFLQQELHYAKKAQSDQKSNNKGHNTINKIIISLQISVTENLKKRHLNEDIIIFTVFICEKIENNYNVPPLSSLAFIINVHSNDLNLCSFHFYSGILF